MTTIFGVLDDYHFQYSTLNFGDIDIDLETGTLWDANLERGLTCLSGQALYADKLTNDGLIAFASVATHTHFYHLMQNGV